MKKTSTRIATIGGVVVLAAFAIALAQHDARKRDRQSPQIELAGSQPAKPIPLEVPPTGDWASGASELTKLVARGNNGRLPTQTNDTSGGERNPLRTTGADSRDQSRVIQASGGIPADDSPPSNLPVLPTSPAWLETAASQQPNLAHPSAHVPTAPSNGFPPGNMTEGGQPSSASTIPALPNYPMNAASKPADPRNPPNAQAATQSGNRQPSLPTQATGMTAIDAAGTTATAADNAGRQSGDAPPSESSAQNSPNSPFGRLNPAVANPQSPNPQAPSSEYLGAGIPSLPPTATIDTGGATGPRTAGSGTSAPSGSNLDPASSYGMGASRRSSPSSTVTQTGWPPASPGSTNAVASLVSNQPGSRYLDGSQNPILLIQKRAPEEIQVGKKATFVIAVRNAGNSTAHEVTVVDSVPRGVRFVESAPAVSPNAQGILEWNLGEMSAGDERTITLQIIPEVQGEVGSVASVHFAAQASVRTVATLPHLELQVETTSEVLIGSRQQLSVTIKNSGTGVARGVRLEADIPDVLKHESGEAQLEAVLGDLRPNELRRITLEVTATQPGQAACAIRATSEDGINAEESVPVEVLAPQLAATIEGPRLRYLDRQATYRIKVQNIGTAPASNLDFVVHLPAGLKYNSANNRGAYDPAQHTITWGLFELPLGETAPIEFTVLPVELGPQAIAFAATGDLGIRAEAKGQVMVEGLAELAFTIGQDNGTIELGTSTTYSVQVTNVGNKPDKDVRLAVQLPSGAKLLAVDAQVNYQAQGNQIIFEPVAEMGNNDTFTYRFQLQHNQAGTQIVRTQLTSANWPVAVIKEEGTLVYNDQN